VGVAHQNPLAKTLGAFVLQRFGWVLAPRSDKMDGRQRWRLPPSIFPLREPLSQGRGSRTALRGKIFSSCSKSPAATCGESSGDCPNTPEGIRPSECWLGGERPKSPLTVLADAAGDFCTGFDGKKKGSPVTGGILRMPPVLNVCSGGRSLFFLGPDS